MEDRCSTTPYAIYEPRRRASRWPWIALLLFALWVVAGAVGTESDDRESPRRPVRYE